MSIFGVGTLGVEVFVEGDCYCASGERGAGISYFNI